MYNSRQNSENSLDFDYSQNHHSDSTTEIEGSSLCLNPDYSGFEKLSNRLFLANGDCLKLFKNLADESIDLILTDPPYNLGNFMHQRNTNLIKMRENHFAYCNWDNLPNSLWLKNMKNFLSQASRTLKNGGALLMFMSLIKVESIIKLATEQNFYYKTTGIWHKTNPMPRNMHLHFVNSTEAWMYFVKNSTTGVFNNQGKVFHDFFETSVTPQKERKYGKHPTQKPVKLLSQFVSLLSNENDVVLDPFMGSGSSAIAALLNNRKFIGFELDEKYYSISKKRITEI